MSEYVTDTHALYSHLTDSPRLSPPARLLQQSGGNFVVATLDVNTARMLGSVPRLAVPDMPDRIIVATAMQLDLPLISRDEAIHRAAIVPVIW